MQWEKYLLSPDGFCYLTEAHFKNTNTLPDQLCQIQTVCFHQMAAATWLRLTLRARLEGSGRLRAGTRGFEKHKYKYWANTNTARWYLTKYLSWSDGCCHLTGAHFEGEAPRLRAGTRVFLPKGILSTSALHSFSFHYQRDLRPVSTSVTTCRETRTSKNWV